VKVNITGLSGFYLYRNSAVMEEQNILRTSKIDKIENVEGSV
jgi:hypothetical protein